MMTRDMTLAKGVLTIACGNPNYARHAIWFRGIEDRIRAREHLDVMHTPELPRCEVDFDILDGRCSFIRSGRLVRPAIVYFVGQRKEAFAYTRVRKRLAAAYPSGRLSSVRDVFVRVSAYVAWRRAGRQAVP